VGVVEAGEEVRVTGADHLRPVPTDAGVLRPVEPEFTLHDLLRAYAARLAADEEPPEQRRAAQARRFDYYLATAAAGRTPGVRPRPAVDRPGLDRSEQHC
jgi:hypothetical protein